MPSPFEKALQDRLQPPLQDAFSPLGYVPHPRQKIFHEMSQRRGDARVSALLFGGARAGGKTAALLAEAIHHAINNDGMAILCLRRTYNELRESFIRELGKRGFARKLGAKWNATEMVLKFPNGSIINFTYSETEIDISRLQGGEYQLICVDEAGLMLPLILERVEEQLRSGARGVPVVGLRMASNPGGPGHSYLRDRFIRPTKYGKNIVLDDADRKVAFIPSKATDNPYIDAGYQAVLDSIADPIRRAAMRDGDWDAMEGAFLTQWNRARHCVPPFDPENEYYLPPEWPRYAAVDYGWAAPYAVLWVAVDNDERLWAYREIYARGIDARDQARLILQAEEKSGDKDVIRIADPSMWGHRGTPLTIADIYGMEGCGLAQADNDRLNGWARVHYYLNDGPACDYHREKGWETCPMFHVFEGNCPMLIDEVASLPRSQSRPDDAETRNVADHLCDCLRYVCSTVNAHSRPVFYDNPPPSGQDIQRLRQEEQQAFNPHQTRVSDLYAAPGLSMTF